MALGLAAPVKRRCLNLCNDIRACATEEEGPARRHATRHDQFVIWSSLFEQSIRAEVVNFWVALRLHLHCAHRKPLSSTGVAWATEIASSPDHCSFGGMVENTNTMAEA